MLTNQFKILSVNILVVCSSLALFKNAFRAAACKLHRQMGVECICVSVFCEKQGRRLFQRRTAVYYLPVRSCTTNEWAAVFAVGPEADTRQHTARGAVAHNHKAY